MLAQDIHYLAPLSEYQLHAEQLYLGLRAGKEEAAWRFKWQHPRYRGRPVSDVAALDLELEDAQLVIALTNSFATWTDLDAFTQSVQQHEPIRWFEETVEAIVSGNEPALRTLLAAHPELIRARSSRKHHGTLLHYLGANGVEDVRQKTPANALEIARILLDAGAETDALADMYDAKCSTMSMLVSSSHPANAGVQAALAKLLVLYGASLEDTGTRWQSALMTALTFGYLQTAQTLPKLGANTNHLPAAAGLGNITDAHRFLPEACESARHIAFALAAMHGHTEIIKLLLDAGEDPDRYQPEGFHSHATPMHHAVWRNQFPVVKLLAECGARLDIRDTLYQATPLQWAEYGGHSDIVAYLQSRSTMG